MRGEDPQGRDGLAKCTARHCREVFEKGPYGTSSESIFSCYARLRPLQHAGDGFESHGRSNHHPTAQCSTSNTIAAGEFCFDAACRHWPRHFATARRTTEYQSTAIEIRSRRTVPAETS